ncbi:MAG: hypothetical protein ACI8UR_001133 [Natronomonas sp.]|jgi:hypothetical protein|uniref:DUF5789 family protein n=1 Tax=Natronomonas sp. TaxID=2184060 RepID=UPI00398A2638
MKLLANVDEKIDAHSYPASCAELIAEYGEFELEVPNGEETLGDALNRLGETTFHDAEDARLATYSAVSKNAIGRENYSDRDAPSINENGPDQVSF